MNPLLLTDFYKTEHHKMYPKGTTKIYSNLTPRKSRIAGVDRVVFFGLQHFILKYLIESFNKDFFKILPKGVGDQVLQSKLKRGVIEEYKRHIQTDTKHIEALWDLGYLPIEIKALPEGTLCPIGVPCLTIVNTHPDFAWLTNYLETLMSCMLWQPITSATIAHEYKKLLTKYAIETAGDDSFVTWQGHDFSFRGMSSVESGILSGMGHLLSFTGTDTIPAIYELERSYEAEGLIGASVPATEHSVQCMHYDFEKGEEDAYFDHLLNLYPTGIVSAVSDGFNLWDVITKTLPKFKDRIMARDGKLVIRPDSGDPVDILCGENSNPASKYHEEETPKAKGVIELLWGIFGGTIVKGKDGNSYKQFDPHIGAIYGDSITLDRAKQICERLKTKGFTSTNVVLGIGSFTYQYNTRDTFGFAMKATYGEIVHPCVCGANNEHRTDNFDCYGACGKEAKEIYKDPITDDGTKKSKKGLLAVYEVINPHIPIEENGFWVKDQCTPGEEKQGSLETVFKDGKLVKKTTLAEIRERLQEYV